MTRPEAAMILGVQETASEIEIQKAYKQLMTRLHPDAGGNSYLASKLNEARDCLLGR
jgi:DnaJ-class molecular chaperone